MSVRCPSSSARAHQWPGLQALLGKDVNDGRGADQFREHLSKLPRQRGEGEFLPQKASTIPTKLPTSGASRWFHSSRSFLIGIGPASILRGFRGVSRDSVIVNLVVVSQLLEHDPVVRACLGTHEDRLESEAYVEQPVAERGSPPYSPRNSTATLDESGNELIDSSPLRPKRYYLGTQTAMWHVGRRSSLRCFSVMLMGPSAARVAREAHDVPRRTLRPRLWRCHAASGTWVSAGSR